MTYPDQPLQRPTVIDALPLTNVNITVALPDGRQLTQTINTTNGPATVDFVVDRARVAAGVGVVR